MKDITHTFTIAVVTCVQESTVSCLHTLSGVAQLLVANVNEAPVPAR